MATRFEVLPPISLTDGVAAQIRDGIAAGRLKPGQRLVESEIASQMGISRAPVREALRQLEFEGLVEGRVRRGYAVRELSTDTLLEVYNLRALLEPVLARSASSRIGPDELALFQTLIDRMRESVRGDDWNEVVNVDREFHALIGRLSGLPLTAQIFDHLNEQVRRFTALMMSSYQEREQIVDEHNALLTALVSGEPERAAHEMRLHLDDARQRLSFLFGESSVRDGRNNSAITGNGVGTVNHAALTEPRNERKWRG